MKRFCLLAFAVMAIALLIVNDASAIGRGRRGGGSCGSGGCGTGQCGTPGSACASGNCNLVPQAPPPAVPSALSTSFYTPRKASKPAVEVDVADDEAKPTQLAEKAYRPKPRAYSRQVASHRHDFSFKFDAPLSNVESVARR
jgi:hypothetical protein